METTERTHSMSGANQQLEAETALSNWEKDIKQNVYLIDTDFQHSIAYYFANQLQPLEKDLIAFGEKVPTELEVFVSENNLAQNLPRIETYDAIGRQINQVVYHPSYDQAGDIIYQTKLLERMSHPGGLLSCLSFLFLSAQTGEAGHNCPIACSAGIIRVLSLVDDFPNRKFYIEKLTTNKFLSNYTGAQFLTEIQGGSDVGLNTTIAKQDDNGTWRIYGDKWFCSNASAELFFATARYDQESKGTRGLGLFLVPRVWEKKTNHFHIKRLKNKLGTRTMATGEITFDGAYAIPMGPLEQSFRLTMDNVLHLSRLFNAFCVLGMSRRAYYIARSYAKHRVAFANPIINYPLVQENLAKMKAENTCLLAGMFAATHLQDQYDTNQDKSEETALLLRLLVNLLKYLTARLAVDHIHDALGVLAGNGTIETFSPIPRFLRDAIICENWEGTHNVLRIQILKDIHKYGIDKIYLSYMEKKLATITNHTTDTQLLKKRLNQLTTDFTNLKQSSNEIQTLLIKDIVDKMGLLYCALMLYFEVQDQIKLKDATSKSDCLTYFCLIHFEPTKEYKQSHLDLMSKVINLL